MINVDPNDQSWLVTHCEQQIHYAVAAADVKDLLVFEPHWLKLDQSLIFPLLLQGLLEVFILIAKTLLVLDLPLQITSEIFPLKLLIEGFVLLDEFF
jgi:hypothetical protein